MSKKSLVDSVQEFDLENFELSLLFTHVVLYMDLITHGKKLDSKQGNIIKRASEILEKESNKLRVGQESREGLQFFWEFYGKNIRNIYEAKEEYSNRLLILSRELSLVESLQSIKAKELCNICASLSVKAQEYWTAHHPNGFKKY